jgi:hypothetical protein
LTLMLAFHTDVVGIDSTRSLTSACENEEQAKAGGMQRSRFHRTFVLALRRKEISGTVWKPSLPA